MNMTKPTCTGVPATTVYLSLANNYISYISSSSFNTTLPSTTYLGQLYLEQNNITGIGPSAFAAFPYMYSL